MDQEPVTDEITAAYKQFAQESILDNSSNLKWITSSTSLPEELCNRETTCEVETTVALHCHNDCVIIEDDHLALSNDDMSEFSNSDISLPEVCISSNSKSFEEDMNYEVQHAYRIFRGFLSEKHKVITSPFLHSNQDALYGIGRVRSRGHAHLRQSMCLHRMEEKFINQEYESITEFVADFRLMLENCYRNHGVDHWLSKQAQKLEIMLEQKLTLLSRTLREKTALAVTSKGRFGIEEERVSTTSTRRRLAPRSLATITVGGHESIMVQTLRVEEQQRAKEEKRQRELEKKEAEEMSAKEMDEWEQSLLSQASPHTVDTLWELPAIGHFLCLAQTALNLPEIVFFELERCLLMPRCSVLLSKIMSSLLCPPQRRSTLHRRPVLPYRRWESELRQRVKVWYHSIGASRDQAAQAEQLGLCYQFFSVLGEVSPLEAQAFHMLPFYQRVWLLKGLCDHVYETQKDVQDAVLAQPIHECRESILGYDSKENAYIHFPHFCGADLRIYCQSPSTPPTFPFPSCLVKKVELLHELEEEASNLVKDTGEGYGNEQFEGSVGRFDYKVLTAEIYENCKQENAAEEDGQRRGHFWEQKTNEQLRSTDEDSSDESKVELKIHTNTIYTHSAISDPVTEPIRKSLIKHKLKEERVEFEHKFKRHKQETGSICSNETLIHKPCLNVGEHCYTGRSPACSMTVFPKQTLRIKTEGTFQGDQRPSCLECCKNKINNIKSEQHKCTSGLATHLSSESAHTSCEERVNDKIWTKKKKRKKKRGKKQLLRMKREHKQLQHTDRRLSQAKAAESAVPIRSSNIKRKEKKKKHKDGKKLDLSKKIKYEPQSEPSFKLVCTNLDDLRDLINKTEDELDNLESTKKRMGRWYYRREAVKDLHSTLIRLLNELSPWEPKLVKAYQRNRLRLKKEFEVFKNQPEYNSFVREECISSSDEDGRDFEKPMHLPSEQYRKSDQEDSQHVVPRGLWVGATVKELSRELAGEKPVTPITHNHLHQYLSATASGPLNTVLSSKPTILHTTTGLPKGYTPIPTLLAKSVGNKVTLMKQPVDYPGINSINGESKIPMVSTKVAPVVATTKPSKTQSFSYSIQQNSQQTHEQISQQAQTIKQPVIDRVEAVHPTSPQFKTLQTFLKKPLQVLYKVHEGPSRLVTNCNTNQSSEEIRPQPIGILPPNLVHKSDEKLTLLHEQSKGFLNPDSKKDPILCMSTNVPCFTIPENRNLVQQAEPLKDVGKTVQTKYSPITSATADSTSLSKSTEFKQELKTVCIRESQSILVTTRGGNTGIVKVQKSSDQNGSLASSPVITISPQFKAFLVSKTSPAIFPSATSQCATIPAVTRSSAVQTQTQVPSALNSPATVTTCAGTGSPSVTAQVSQSVRTTVATNIGQPVLTAVASPHLHAALVKNTVPSTSSFVTAQSSTAGELISKPHLKQTSTDDRSQVAKFILVSPTSSTSPVNISCTKTLPTSVMLISQPPATSSMMLIQGSNTVLKQAATTGASGQLLMTSSSQKMVNHTIGSVDSESMPKDKDIAISSGINIQLPGQITTIGQAAAALPKCPSKTGATEQMISTSIAQIPVTKSNIISNCTSLPTPASSQLTSLKHHGISSITMISQPGSFTTTCPSPNSFSAANAKKNHGMSNILSSNSNVHIPSSQSSPNPTSAHSMNQQCLNNLFISNISGCVNNTSLSSHLSLTKPQASSTMLEPTAITGSTEILATPTTNAPTKSTTGTIQQRIVINTSAPLAGGTHIILNNGHFVVPPQGLGPGSHVLIISGHAPQQVPRTSTTTTREAVPLQGANHVTVAPQAPVLLQSSTRLPSVPAISSPSAACTPAVVPSMQATSPGVPTGRLTGLNPTLLASKTNVAWLPSLQSVNLATPAGGASVVSALPRLDNVLPLVSAVLTNTVGSAIRSESLTTTTATLAPPLPGLSPPTISSTILPSQSTVALLPVKADPATPLPVMGTACTQGVLSSPQTTQSLSPTTLASRIPPQHPTVRIATISNSSSTALMRMGLSSTSFRKQEPALIQTVLTGAQTTSLLPTLAVPPVVSKVSRVQTLPIATVPLTSSTVKSIESSPSTLHM